MDNLFSRLTAADILINETLKKKLDKVLLNISIEIKAYIYAYIHLITLRNNCTIK